MEPRSKPNSSMEIFGWPKSKSNISEHIKHILEKGELDENSVVRNFRTTASDNKHHNVKHYNLDMILAIGYRVRSNIGTNFRKWATSTLKEYVTKGFALNDDLLKEAGGRRTRSSAVIPARSTGIFIGKSYRGGYISLCSTPYIAVLIQLCSRFVSWQISAIN